MKLAGHLIAVLLVSGWLTGCSSLTPEPERQAHELAPMLPSATKRARLADALFVSPIRTLAPYATTRMAYRQQNYQLSYFARNEWAAEPAELIRPWLLRGLTSSGLFASVVSGAGAPPTRYRLDVEIFALRHDFDAEPSLMRLVLRVQLVDLDERYVVASKLLDLHEPSATRDAYGGVVAANRLVAAALSEIVALCEKALRG